MEQQIRITNTHEKTDVIMVNQAYDVVLQNGVGRVHVACDDTDVFSLSTYFFWKLNSSRNAVDINKTVGRKIDLIPSLLAAHALSGHDTTARYYGIAKGTVVKQLKKACNYCSLGTLKVIQQMLYKSAQSLLVHAMVLQQQI